MERRRHRLAVLLLVAALHVPALMMLAAWTRPRERATASSPLEVEFVVRERAAAPPPPSPRRARAGGNPRVTPVKAANPVSEPPADSNVRPDDEVRLFSADGSLRISSKLAAEIALPAAAEARNTFHLPAGDTWVLRKPAAPIEFRDTIFAKSFVPESMNPIEEACWHNKGLAFLLTLLGSTDCAAPGQKSKVPPPELIVYGVDDGDEILRKHAAWARYNAR